MDKDEKLNWIGWETWSDEKQKQVSEKYFNGLSWKEYDTACHEFFPDWFDWRTYAVLKENLEPAGWPFQFAQRDPAFQNDYQRGVTFTDGTLPVYHGNTLPKLIWQKGVMSYGLKGHDTHRQLEYPPSIFSRKAEFITEDEFQKRQKEKSFPKGTYITTAPGGRHVFPDVATARKHQDALNASYARTIELAINFHMPKKDILEEVARIVEETQKKYLGGIVKRKKLPRQTPLMWARGLACWELKKLAGWSNAEIARNLVPLWRFELPYTGEANDTDEKLVRDALGVVKPMIDGGWRSLCGDPTVTPYTDLLEIIRRKPTR